MSDQARSPEEPAGSSGSTPETAGDSSAPESGGTSATVGGADAASAPDGAGSAPETASRFWLGGALGFLIPALIVVAGVLWVVHLTREQMQGKLDPPAVAGETQLSLNWQFEPITDVAPAFADVKGKVIFLNVWATWCNPCRMEMPSIQALYRKVSANPAIAVVCVSDEKPEAIRQFLAAKQLELPVYQARNNIPAALHTDGIPATFILDPSGKVMFQHVGAAQWDDDMVVSFLESLTAEGS